MGIYFDAVVDENHLYESFLKCKKNTQWKESVQRFEACLFQQIHKIKQKLMDGSYKQLPFVEFELCERGKRRHIKSLHISDRMIQRSICDYVLSPVLEKHLIYDNGASIKGKGVEFTRNRLQCHFEKYMRHYGLNGYILKGDFSKFFDNIDHKLALEAIGKHIKDEEFMNLLKTIVDSFKIDVSDLTTEELEYYETHPVDLLNLKVSNKGQKFLYRSFGIGSQISQIVGVFYPTPIDHLIKVRFGCKYYGRYMDDFYIIHPDKEYLKKVLDAIRTETSKLKMFLNESKTKIIPIRRGFTFMKIKYNFSRSGKILKRLSADSFSRERRKLKKYAKMNGKNMSPTDIHNAYLSWRGNAIRYNSNRSVQRMDNLYYSLFKEGKDGARSQKCD